MNFTSTETAAPDREQRSPQRQDIRSFFKTMQTPAGAAGRNALLAAADALDQSPPPPPPPRVEQFNGLQQKLTSQIAADRLRRDLSRERGADRRRRSMPRSGSRSRSRSRERGTRRRTGSDDDDEKPKPRPVLRRDVPVLPARYTRHCGGECGPGQVAVYDVHRQTVGGAAHKVEAVRAAHVDPSAGTAGELFAGLVPEQKKVEDETMGNPKAPKKGTSDNDSSDDDNASTNQSVTATEKKAEPTPAPMHVVATVYHHPARGFPLLPQRRVVAPTAEAAADIAVSAAPTAEGTGHAAVAVYGRLTDAELEETTGAAYDNADDGESRNPFTGEMRHMTRGGFFQQNSAPGGRGGRGRGGMPGMFDPPGSNMYDVFDDRGRGRGARGRARGYDDGGRGARGARGRGVRGRGGRGRGRGGFDDDCGDAPFIFSDGDSDW